MFPMNRDYYEKPIKPIADDFFITYRNDYYMCYNAAPPKVWAEIFNINSLDDCYEALAKSLPKGYVGHRGAKGWFHDQYLLGKNVKAWSKFKTHHKKNIEQGVRRLECSALANKNNHEKIKQLHFTDLHLNCLKDKDVDVIYSLLPLIKTCL